MRILCIILLLFFEFFQALDLKKAYESNNNYYQGIVKGKVKSIKLCQGKVGEINNDRCYVTMFDTAGNVPKFFFIDGTMEKFTYEHGKLIKEERYNSNSKKPYDISKFIYKDGILIEKLYLTGGDNNRDLYYYENGKILKIIKYFNGNTIEIQNYKYGEGSEEIIYTDSVGKMIRFFSKKYLASENKVATVFIDSLSKVRYDGYFIFDKDGNEIESEDVNIKRKSKYLKYDSLGNWTSKTIYWNNDTFIANRIIEYF